MQKVKETQLAEGTLLLMFRVGDTLCAVDTAHVREVTKSLPLTPVPRAGRGLHGLCNLRGDVLPVVNLHDALGLEHDPSFRNHRILIAEHGGQCFGALVDSVVDLVTADRSRFAVPSVADQLKHANIVSRLYVYGESVAQTIQTDVLYKLQLTRRTP